MLSSLLDITGFFVSVLINLLLIALICYYFKRKIDNLEFSQSEQAKTLYTLISQQNNMTAMNNETNTIVTGANDIMSGLDLTQLNQNSHNEDDETNDSEVDSEESESESEEEQEDEEASLEEEQVNDEQPELLIQTINMVSAEEDVKQIEFDNQIQTNEENDESHEDNFILQQDGTDNGELVEDEGQRVEQPDEDSENYGKMTVKELKTLLAEKGVHAKSSMNKSDMINILKGATNVGLETDGGNM